MRRLRSFTYAASTSASVLVTTCHCDSQNQSNSSVKDEKVYRLADISKHSSLEKGDRKVWVAYKDGVYDITSFIPNHPGGRDKIMLGAGKSIDPFWNLYRQHYGSVLAQEQLTKLRVGRLHPDDIAAAEKKYGGVSDNSNDPYTTDPSIPPVLHTHQQKPINAEAPGTLLTDSWITPADAWFIRNHHPVPQIDPKEFKLVISGVPNKGQDITLTLDDIKDTKRFKRHTIVSSLQCGGNRRGEMNRVAMTAGTPWNISAISTAEWTGVRLTDILKACGVDIDEESLENNGIAHCQFAAYEDMEASIPIKKAVSRSGDVILAFEMNGQDIPASHGYPLRAVVPGHVGVRNVKWLRKITLSAEEARGPWQRSMAYKGFGPSTKTIENIDVEKIPSVQEQAVQSCITHPQSSSALEAGSVETIKGYAYSGGGRGIVRVDVSADGGKTWTTAALGRGSEQPLDRAWAWTFWEADIEVPAAAVSGGIEIVCKAVDASYNVQPDSVEGIWNLRGINNNAWHRVKVDVRPPADDDIE